MNQELYHAAIVLHIVGITFLAGATVIDFLGFRMFWRSVQSNRQRSVVILETNALCQRLMEIGLLLIIISGVAMMTYMHKVWGQQIWFRIKFALVLLVIINGLGIRRMLGSRLNKSILVATPEVDIIFSNAHMKRNIAVVHVVQFVLLIAIFILSVFKFN